MDSSTISPVKSLSNNESDARHDKGTATSHASFRLEPEGEHFTHSNRAPRGQLFAELGKDEMSRIAAHARGLRKARGEFIYMPGDSADLVYIVRQGRVKLSVLSGSGKEVAIDIIRPGEIFGEFALIDESSRSNMTQALDDVSVWVFHKRDFTRLLSTLPKLAINYIRLVGDRRRRMEKKLSDITSKAVSARVCELLHELTLGVSEMEAVTRDYLVPLMHHDIASLIGASRQTTTSVLNDLERRGIIELGRGWIRIKCLKDLQTYSAIIFTIGLQFFFALMSAT
ncbi:MAG TPA: Crp/Fnr family transcriptional regulator [Pyrinomonadaceae bacterium]|jgi:CRP/FNR family transcriptional regulator